jgi:hypothetical protein
MYSSAILDLSTRWKLDACYRPRPPYFWGKVPVTHWLGCWVEIRACLDVVQQSEITCSCWDSNPGCKARSRSLHGLSYPGSLHKILLELAIEERGHLSRMEEVKHNMQHRFGRKV